MNLPNYIAAPLAIGLFLVCVYAIKNKDKIKAWVKDKVKK